MTPQCTVKIPAPHMRSMSGRPTALQEASQVPPIVASTPAAAHMQHTSGTNTISQACSRQQTGV